MTGCCDICEKSGYLVAALIGMGRVLYICYDCFYLNPEEDGDDDFETNDGTLDTSGGVRDGR